MGASQADCACERWQDLTSQLLKCHRHEAMQPASQTLTISRIISLPAGDKRMFRRVQARGVATRF
eukprot:1590595-Amphidinium_carterae.1